MNTKFKKLFLSALALIAAVSAISKVAPKALTDAKAKKDESSEQQKSIAELLKDKDALKEGEIRVAHGSICG